MSGLFDGNNGYGKLMNTLIIKKRVTNFYRNASITYCS